MTILCEPDEHAAASLVTAIGGAVQTVATLSQAAMTMVSDPAERVVVVGRHLPLEQTVSFIGHLRRERADVAVILVRDSLEPDTLAEAGHAGLFAVVPTGEPALLADACARAHRAGRLHDADPVVPDAERRGRVVTVFSAKGGTGKTTVSTNLAVALTDGQTRTVCLVDLDLEFGDVAISMRLTPSRTLVDAVETAFADTEETLDALVTQFRPGIGCILAPIEPGESARVPAELVTQLLDGLRARFDFVVIDTPSHFSEHVLAALDASDHHVLITTPEIPALKNLRLTIDMLDLLSYSPAARSIVLNRADEAAGLTKDEVESAIKTAIDAAVPYSRDVPASINRGVPLTAAHPDHPFSLAIRHFAALSLLGQQEVGQSRAGLRGMKLRMRSR